MFFAFDQNNSGGTFDFNAEVGIAPTICIEAETEGQAVGRLSELLEDARYDPSASCECCGERWSFYPRTVEVPRKSWGRPFSPVPAGSVVRAFVHYADGRIEGFL